MFCIWEKGSAGGVTAPAVLVLVIGAFAWGVALHQPPIIRETVKELVLGDRVYEFVGTDPKLLGVEATLLAAIIAAARE